MVSPDMEDGEYDILNDKIFARVMSYTTLFTDACILEAHNKYVDIQFSINGAEGISVFDRTLMEIKDPYSEEKDVVLFMDNESALLAHTNNCPGYFTMLFPSEAHRPRECVGKCEIVKKAVIKVQADILKEFS